MKTSMHVLLLLTIALALGGCSSTLSLPWESDALDPGRIATHEPLEIPPDLDVLPDPNGKKVPPLDAWVSPDQAPKSSGGSATLPFETPATQGTNDNLSRDEKEKLPGWMDESVRE